MDTSDWTPPAWAVRLHNPEARAEWAARVKAWHDANPDLAAAWEEALFEDEARTYERAEARAKLERLRQAGVPTRAVEAWAKGLDATRAVEAVRTFQQSEKCFLLLLGSPGCGKTVAAAAALTKGGVFVRAVELARLSSFDAADRATFARCCDARVLVLDDLGAELLHDGWRPALDELVDVRYGERLPTLLTTNLDAASFKARYGERIADRIRHDGFVETCGDKSRRRPTP